MLSVASNQLMKERTERLLGLLVSEIRIDVDIEVIAHDEGGQTITDLMRSKNTDADVVIFGLAKVESGSELDYAERLVALAGDSPAVFFVKNSSLFSGDLLLPGDDEQAVLSADGEEPTQHKKEPNHDRSHQRAIRPVRTTGSI